MGNAQVKLNESNKNLLITQPLLENFKKHLTIIDHAVTGLARGIDALQKTCEFFLQQNQESKVQQNKDIRPSEGATILIIQKINECITDNKEVTLHSIKNFFSFVKNTGEVYIENADDVFSSLSVSSYQKFHLDDDTQRDWFTEFYNRRLEFSNKEIELLQLNNEALKKEIETLKEKQTHLDNEFLKATIKDLKKHNKEQKEKPAEALCETNHTHESCLKSTVTQTHINTCQNQTEKQNQNFTVESVVEEVNKVTTVQDDVALMSETIIKLRKEIELLEENNSKMKRELLEKDFTIKQLTKRTMKVQAYKRSFYATTTDAEKDFWLRLEKEFSKKDVNLDVTICKSLSQITDGVPLLISSNHITSGKRNGGIETAIQEFDYRENKAVLVFHQKEEKDLPYQLSQYDDKINTLGGIFHFGYKGSLYNSAMNKNSIDGVIGFIEKFGEVQQNRMEKHS